MKNLLSDKLDVSFDSMVNENIDEANKRLTQQIEDFFKNNFERLPISDKVVISKIRTLPVIYETNVIKKIRPYSEPISNFFNQVLTGNNNNQCSNYFELKLHFLNQALKELWVIEARKGETFEPFKNFELFEKSCCNLTPNIGVSTYTNSTFSC